MITDTAQPTETSSIKPEAVEVGTASLTFDSDVDSFAFISIKDIPQNFRLPI